VIALVPPLDITTGIVSPTVPVPTIGLGVIVMPVADAIEVTVPVVNDPGRED